MSLFVELQLMSVLVKENIKWNMNSFIISFLAYTAFDAQDLGFRTIMIDDCSRGIVNENITSTFDKIKSKFGCVVQSSEVKSFTVCTNIDDNMFR